jgi:LPS-assembly protein
MQLSRFVLFNIAVAVCHLLCGLSGGKVQAQSTSPASSSASTVAAPAPAGASVVEPAPLPAAVGLGAPNGLAFVVQAEEAAGSLADMMGPAVCMSPDGPLLPVPPLQGQGTQGVSPLQTTPLPGVGELASFNADNQQKEGTITHLRGNVEILYHGMILTADEVDYDDETGIADARGHVHYVDKVRQEDIFSETAHYDVSDDTGTFVQASGTYGSHVKPGGSKSVYLTTTNPFFFESPLVDRTGPNTYLIHDGWITSCTVPGELWKFQGKRILLKPEQYFVAHGGWMKIMGIPIFYMPYFRHTLQKEPRMSGFLTPHFGTSTIKGIFFGEDYYWAINRSMDLLAGAEIYTARGWAQDATYRWRGEGENHLAAVYFGVVDHGLVVNGVRQTPEGGETASIQGSYDLPDGFRGIVNFNYLSSYIFRLAFTPTYGEAIGSEVHTQVFASKHWDDYDFHVGIFRYQDYQSTTPNDSIQIRSLPSIQFTGHDRPLFSDLPIYFSFDTAADFLNRSQVGLSTPAFVSRFDFFPKVTSPFHWGHWDFVVSFGERATAYTSSVEPETATAVEHVIGTDRVRTAGEADLEIRPPALEKIFQSPIKALGDKWKHTIEPKITVQYVGGISNPGSILLFDDRDIMVNTQDVTVSVIQRLLSKRDKDGEVRELVSWEVGERYYLDPTFGGAVVDGQRNVFSSTIDYSPFAFVDAARRWAPVFSDLRLNLSHRFEIDSVLQYDPYLHRLTAGSMAGTVRRGKLFASGGHDFSRGDPLLEPHDNLVHATLGYGSSSGRGPNVIWTAVPDLHNGGIQYQEVQFAYNTDCCGFIAEWLRTQFGVTQANSTYRVEINFANVGSVGNIKKKERLF